jgi:6-phosphogluconate dehydrogenase
MPKIVSTSAACSLCFALALAIHPAGYRRLPGRAALGCRRVGAMELGMVGLGRMGANMARRLMRDGHRCVVYDVNPDAVSALVEEGAEGAFSPAELASKLSAPRAVWVMVPSGEITAKTIEDVAAVLDSGDAIVDGGNSYYRDDIRRAVALREQGIDFVDCGTSGGVFGLERGYCLMIGGPDGAVERLDSIFASLAPGVEAAKRTPGCSGDPSPAEKGYLHCGPNGAGHFVKMVHNGIEYGIMAAYAEGLNILRNADAGKAQPSTDAETAPLEDPQFYEYDIALPDVAEVWRRGSVIDSWLLDLTAAALRESPDLADFSGRVSDSGEGRWTSIAAIEEGVPAPVLTTALYERFSSRGLDDFADQVLSAMRKQFGGHDEKPS